MRLLTTTFLILLLFSAPVAAESLDGALSRAFQTDPDGLRLLRESGASYGGVLTLERLPSHDYAVEVAVDVEGSVARYPLKLRRDGERWTLAWQPTGVYAAALVGIIKSGALATARAERRWVDAARMPALPIIGTPKRFVTPFGEVASDDRARNLEGQGQSQGDLDLSPKLVDHVHRWVRTFLDEDPGPAGVDLILAGSASWRLANKLLFNTSVVGLYQISLITGDSGELGVVQVASPVGATGEQATPTVVAMYPIDGEPDRFGMRLSVDGEPVEGEGCAPAMTLCIDEPALLPDRLERLVPPGGSRAMFAAPASVTVGDAIAYLAAFVDYMGLGDHHILMGYVQK